MSGPREHSGSRSRSTCPKCGSALSLFRSGDTLVMRFLFCTNPTCDYIESYASFMASHRLPAPYEEVTTVLENECREAERVTRYP